ncbi:putative nucleoporin [Helianthus annuus]|nr:putative nucleoporin [Helianthus annuus]KAJ0869497.1 putative nucleoporin [Helianthus annuus]KAJ0874020.1 putative nucleoporin [Helianthus annuus]
MPPHMVLGSFIIINGQCKFIEHYKMSAGACHFAVAALEQFDEVLGLSESPITTKGRLWANVFKFTLDLNHYHDAYCAIISNPDEESKYICLRRFIIVLYEHGAIKV